MTFERNSQPPPYRRLRGYAIDPSLSLSLATSQVNLLVYKVPWEELDARGGETWSSYPAGEYVEIVDYDPASQRFYDPVNLDDPYLLAQDGLPPNVGNPQFHQQMVYAVIMTTIMNFEKALGRKIQWAENIPIADVKVGPGSRPELEFGFVQKLRVYPHALRQANAYYDPYRKALLFGYFAATPPTPQLQLPGATVFTCLSHDIIAHETTHAILDGLHRRYIDATHPDTRAFHEAFADLVALFQHFTFPEVLRHQIAATRGDLNRQNLLGQLAIEFGQAIGGYGSLRDAIGQMVDGQWRPHVPDPADYVNILQPHRRGAILVAAVFDAFLNIYQNRVKKLLRIATGGSGILPDGELHPDLVDEMSRVAAGVAEDVLRICIRALDYCPPMDITFGDYLRAIITADSDMVAEDKYGYRVAFVEAFRRRGINSSDVKSMAVEELVHPFEPGTLEPHLQDEVGEFLRELKQGIAYLTDRKEIYDTTKSFIRGSNGLHRLIERNFASEGEVFGELTGMMFPTNQSECERLGIEFGYISKKVASYAISNVWLANRVTPDGGIVNHVVITMAQKRGVRFTTKDDSVSVDEDGFFVPDKTPNEDRGDAHIIFRGGCTLVFDIDSMRLRYAIKKDLNDRSRMIRQFRFEHGMMSNGQATYFDARTLTGLAGPFAMVHSCTASHGGSDAY
jgi:hypothetical protein